jgi:hypothetical protein
MRLYDYGDDGSPTITRVQLFMNAIARTQRDLARLHGEITQMVAADPSLKKYITDAFRTPPRLVIDNDPSQKTCPRPRKLRDDHNDDERRRPILARRRRSDDDDGPKAA